MSLLNEHNVILFKDQQLIEGRKGENIMKLRNHKQEKAKERMDFIKKENMLTENDLSETMAIKDRIQNSIKQANLQQLQQINFLYKQNNGRKFFRKQQMKKLSCEKGLQAPETIKVDSPKMFAGQNSSSISHSPDIPEIPDINMQKKAGQASSMLNNLKSMKSYFKHQNLKDYQKFNSKRESFEIPVSETTNDKITQAKLNVIPNLTETKQLVQVDSALQNHHLSEKEQKQITLHQIYQRKKPIKIKKEPTNESFVNENPQDGDHTFKNSDTEQERFQSSLIEHSKNKKYLEAILNKGEVKENEIKLSESGRHQSRVGSRSHLSADYRSHLSADERLNLSGEYRKKAPQQNQSSSIDPKVVWQNPYLQDRRKNNQLEALAESPDLKKLGRFSSKESEIPQNKINRLNLSQNIDKNTILRSTSSFQKHESLQVNNPKEVKQDASFSTKRQSFQLKEHNILSNNQRWKRRTENELELSGSLNNKVSKNRLDQNVLNVPTIFDANRSFNSIRSTHSKDSRWPLSAMNNTRRDSCSRNDNLSLTNKNSKFPKIIMQSSTNFNPKYMEYRRKGIYNDDPREPTSQKNLNYKKYDSNDSTLQSFGLSSHNEKNENNYSIERKHKSLSHDTSKQYKPIERLINKQINNNNKVKMRSVSSQNKIQTKNQDYTPNNTVFHQTTRSITHRFDKQYPIKKLNHPDKCKQQSDKCKQQSDKCKQSLDKSKQPLNLNKSQQNIINQNEIFIPEILAHKNYNKLSIKKQNKSIPKSNFQDSIDRSRTSLYKRNTRLDIISEKTGNQYLFGLKQHKIDNDINEKYKNIMNKLSMQPNLVKLRQELAEKSTFTRKRTSINNMKQVRFLESQSIEEHRILPPNLEASHSPF